MSSLRLSQITADPAMQPRAKGLNEDHVAELVDAILAGRKLPEVVVYDTGTENLLSEGFHRFEAHKRAKKANVPCEIRQGTRDECKLNALASNQGHGLKRTNADKKRAVTEVLKMCPDWSDARIAEHTGVSQPFVSEMRSQVITVIGSGTPDRPEVRTGKDGKKYKVNSGKGKKGKEKGKSGTPKTDDNGKPVNQEGDKPDDDSEQSGTSDQPPTVSPEDSARQFLEGLDGVCREMDQIVGRMRELKEHPLAVHVHFPSAIAQAEAARKTLWQGRPAYECPYCRKEGRVRPDCDSCRGFNRVKKTTYDSGERAVGGGAA